MEASDTWSHGGGTIQVELLLRRVTATARDVTLKQEGCREGNAQPLPLPPPPTGPLAKLSKHGSPRDASSLKGVIQEPRAERMDPGAGQGEGEQAKDSQLRQLMWKKIVLTYRIVSELF